MTDGAIRRVLVGRVIGVGRLVIIRIVASETGIGRIIVIAVVAGGAIIGNGCMGALEDVVVVVVGKRRRHPARIGGMACSAIGGEAQGLVVGIRGLVEIRGMTSRTFGRCPLVTIGVALDAIDRGMRAGQRELRGIVVERIVGAAGRVAGQTGVILINIPADTAVLIVGLRVGMAIGAGHLCIIGRVSMAIDTLIPLAVMGPAVDGEILPVVVEGGRRPARLIMATGAIRRELSRLVVGIGRLVVVRIVAPETGIRRIVIITVVAGGAVVGNGGVRSLEDVVVVVVGKGRRHPTRIGGMARSAIGGEAQGLVVGIGRLGKIRRVA